MTDMEDLTSGIGGIGNILARWMPVRIDAQAKSLRSGSVIGRHLTIATQDSRSMSSTNVQAQVAGVSPIKAVTVDTAIKLGILNERGLVER